jgi:hypothetical protein
MGLKRLVLALFCWEHAKWRTRRSSLRWLFNFDAWKPDDGDWGDALELIPEEERARIGRLVLS